MIFSEELKKRQDFCETVIREYLPKEEDTPGQLAAAMNYSMLAGGKRIRPILMLESFRSVGGKEENLLKPFMAAMEMIHTSSLIHDDLPAIDNDEFRRGRKTTHAFYGAALGVLSGDALENYAYETAAKAFDEESAKDPEISRRVIRALRLLLAKTGIYGMLGGQSVDVENEKNQVYAVPKETLGYIYLHKTGALLEASLMIGAILAGADDRVIQVMEEVGTKTGLAFQIEDDILDVTSTTEELGKPVHSDEKNDKTTYVTLMGVDQAQKQVDTLSLQAMALLEEFGEDGEFLKELIRKLAQRKN